jgi:hypothetical protein
VATAQVPPLPAPAEVITAGGTMVANPPPSNDLRSLTPLPELHSPAPLLGGHPMARPSAPPPPPLPRHRPPADATVVDLQAQLKASLEAKTTLAGHPVPLAIKPPPYRPREDKKD